MKQSGAVIPTAEYEVEVLYDVQYSVEIGDGDQDFISHHDHANDGRENR